MLAQGDVKDLHEEPWSMCWWWTHLRDLPPSTLRKPGKTPIPPTPNPAPLQWTAGKLWAQPDIFIEAGREKLYVFSSPPHSTPNTDQPSILPSSDALYIPERMKPGNIIHPGLPCPGLIVCAVWALRWPPEHSQILLVFPGGSLC